MTGAGSGLLALWSPSLWGDYLRRYKSYRGMLAASAAMSVLQSLFLVPIAYVIKIGFDRIVARQGAEGLIMPSAVILVLTAASAIAAVLGRHWALVATKYVIRDIRLELFAKSYGLSAIFSSTSDRSRLHTVIVQDTERLDIGSNAVVVVAIPGFITSAIFLAAMAYLAPLLLLATAVAAPLAILSDLFLGRVMRRHAVRFRQAFEGFDENVLAALRRIELTRLRGAVEHEIADQFRRMDELRRVSGRWAWISTAYGSVQSSILAVAGVVTLIVGGLLVAAGTTDLSSLAAYYFILSRLNSSLAALWTAAPQILSGADSLANIAKLEALDCSANQGGTRQHSVEGAVELRQVHFSYGARPLLAGIDLCIVPGERVAIMGPNGSGKTTLAHLILGLQRAHAGQILIDGIPITELAPDHYRRQVGVVLQDMLLFAGTIGENLRYGHVDASAEASAEALKTAQVQRFLSALPDGLDTHIGADGMALSGGQSQTLALARALLGRPKLLILDEPTNHLDERTTAQLFAELDALDWQPSVILITHDIVDAARFDRVYRLEEGRLLEIGIRAVAKMHSS